MNENNEEKKKREYKPLVQYKIVLNLRGLIGAEEEIRECEDGVRREGVFIPYEENGVYRGEKYALMNISAVIFPKHERNEKSIMATATHYLQYYWNAQVTKKMADLGYIRDRIKIGWMEAHGALRYKPKKKSQ